MSITTHAPSLSRRIRFSLPSAGPGLVVMLADTGRWERHHLLPRSGAQWGYQLLLLQGLLIPVLFIVQELTVRLGVVDGERGTEDLIKQHFREGVGLGVGRLAAGGLSRCVDVRDERGSRG